MPNNTRKTCFTFYWLADTPVYNCPRCGSCDYSLQLREDVLYSIVCNACGFQGPEQTKEAGTSFGTIMISAIWDWNLAHLD